MKSVYLLKNLNSKQREAVASPRKNMLILAGAGSGKTRVLVHRIAWLLTINKVSPFSILVVTFTNKASAAMRHQINVLVGSDKDDMWVGTFHGLAYRLLREHYVDANLPQYFQILDGDDQYRLVHRILKENNIDKSTYSPRKVMWYINEKKDQGLRPHDIVSYGNTIEAIFLRAYKAYQDACDRAGLVDFAELLLRAYELWLYKPRILQYYSNRFTNILIDEFQDTNRIQYSWIRVLAGNTSNVMIFGDDDQSIYGWRGAQAENMQRFLLDFPAAKTIRLEQNYRSTNNILKSANELISHNDNRLGKNLWTEELDGAPISIYCGTNELDEASYVISRIQDWNKQGGSLKQCAILYRSNAQSRVIEEALLQSAIPYCLYSGQRFFERQEIKDAISYLRLISNRHDDSSFERVVNKPVRGIGERTLDIVRLAAREKQFTLWESCKYLLRKKIFRDRSAIALERFLELIDAIDKKTMDMPLYAQTDRVIRDSGLRGIYEQETDESAKSRIENLEELITAARQFRYQEANNNLKPLQAFLSHSSLESCEGQKEQNQDAVQLMTLHSAKGLEFPLVFIIGMEEGAFPSQKSIEVHGQLLEERRLAYVGLTRAMKKLTLTYTKSRRLYGKEVYCHPSRFLSELPIECIEIVCLHDMVACPDTHQKPSLLIGRKNIGDILGQCVNHTNFVAGMIVNIER